MKEYIYEGKDEEKLLNEGLEDLKVTLEEVVTYTTTEKTGLLKKEVKKVHIIKLDDIVDFIKDYLKDITKSMGLDVQMESKIRDSRITIKMFSDDNSILIGKDGKTLKALTTVVKQVVYNEIHTYPYLALDVSDYKEKQDKHLERLAKNIAKEVSKTKEPVTLENMNSYQRRVVHNALSKFKNVYTKSEGEEPNRHVIVYPKED